MSEKIAVIGRGSHYAEELNAILSDSMICFQNPHVRRAENREQNVRKKRHPWNKVHLSKVERKGKTYEQIQELRAMKWERQNNKRLHSEQNPPREILAVKLI